MLKLSKFLTGVFILILAYTSTSSSAEKIQFGASSSFKGKPFNLSGELSLAKKKSMQPVVILMHGCGGLQRAVKSSLRRHASRLNQNGFATLILDSFSPRKVSGGWVCRKLSRLASARAYRKSDVLDAIKYLSSRTEIDSKNIFLMGQSNGGSVASIMSKKQNLIRAAVAFYPWCGAVPANPSVPLLVLSGAKDDWTPPANCKTKDKPGGKLSVIIYPDAYHSFDLNIPVTTYQGHKVGGNPSALRKSSLEMIKFLKRYIKK